LIARGTDAKKKEVTTKGNFRWLRVRAKIGRGLSTGWYR